MGLLFGERILKETHHGSGGIGVSRDSDGQIVLDIVFKGEERRIEITLSPGGARGLWNDLGDVLLKEN